MASWTYRKRRRDKMLREMANKRAAKARKHEAETAGLPVRESRVIEITIRDSHRPMTVIRATQTEHEGVGSRWRIAEYSGRPVGKTGLARLLAQYVA